MAYVRALAAVPYDRAPYRSRYPGLASIIRDNPALPKGNIIRRNIGQDKGWLAFNDGVDSLGLVTVRDNIVGGDPGFMNPKAGDFRLAKRARAFASGSDPSRMIASAFISTNSVRRPRVNCPEHNV